MLSVNSTVGTYVQLDVILKQRWLNSLLDISTNLASNRNTDVTEVDRPLQKLPVRCRHHNKMPGYFYVVIAQLRKIIQIILFPGRKWGGIFWSVN